MKPRYIIFFIFLIIFSIFVYIFIKSGNNIISENQENVIEKILNLKEYEAKVKVIIYSNKNQNEYLLEQKENIDTKYSYQKVLSNGILEGLTIELKEEKLVLSNSKLKLDKIYENYLRFADNYLFISNFISEINTENIKEKDDEILLSTKTNNNMYLHMKTLYINKENGLPKKMVIVDKKQKVKAIIEYIEIKFKI